MKTQENQIGQNIQGHASRSEQSRSYRPPNSGSKIDPHRKTKRSPPLGELDSGVASLSFEDPGAGPVPVNFNMTQKNIILEEKNLEQKSQTLPERSKARTKRRFLPRHPSIPDDSSLHGITHGKQDKGPKSVYYRSQPDLRSSPPHRGHLGPFDSSSDEWHRRNEFNRKI